MKKSLLIMAVSTIMALSACQDRPTINEIEAKLEQKTQTEKADNTSSPTDALKALDQTLSGNKVLNAKEVKFEAVPYTYELPNQMKQICGFDNKKTDKETGEVINFCTEVDIKLAKVNPVWIEQIVNKSITNDDNPKLLKFKQDIDDFVAEHLAYIEELRGYAKENNEEFNYAPLYSWTVEPKLLQGVNNVAQVVISSDIYMGGAHGVPSAEYLIFDMDLQSQITLGNILNKDKGGEFHELAYTAFKDYLRDELDITSSREIKEYEQTWEFSIPENFYFANEGLVLVYQPYEMGSFAQGFIELMLPYEALAQEGILKTQYLPTNTQAINNRQVD